MKEEESKEERRKEVKKRRGEVKEEAGIRNKESKGKGGVDERWASGGEEEDECMHVLVFAEWRW